MTAGRTLVTGATGSLGSNLTRRLVKEGAEVVVFKPYGERLGELTPLARNLEVRFGDVRDLASVRRAMRGVRRVFHLAGLAAPLNNRLAQAMWEINVVGAHHVAVAALESGVERMVHTSSIAAVGFPPNGVIADESFDYRDSVLENAYSISKHWGERAVLGVHTLGLPIVVLNPAAVMAPGGSRRFGWPALVDRARRGRIPFYPPGGTAMCAVADLIDAQLKAMDRGRPGERYIVSTANVAYQELGTMVAEVVGARPPRVAAPRWALRAAGWLGGVANALRADPLSAPVVLPETVALMARTVFYDQSRSVRELGVTQSSLRESVREVFDWLVAAERSEAGGRSTHARAA